MAIQHQYDDDDSENLQIHLVPELRKRIKQAAEESHLSVQEYIESFLEQTIPAEPLPVQEQDDGLNLAAIEDLLAYRDEIKRNHPDVEFGDSAELLHKIREERMRELEQR